jgi:hypothetical protein
MRDDLVEIIYILDRSGSMVGLENDTIGGFNAFVEKQRQIEGETIITTVLFDNNYEILWNGISADKAKLTGYEYFVRGSTALLDAIGKTIVDVGYRLSHTSKDQRPGKVIFVITTDGLENASREFTHDKVKDLIQHQQEKYSWEFIFLGANIDAAKGAYSIGIPVRDAYAFESSKVGVRNMYSVAGEAVCNKRQGVNKKG